jgi:pimeloyl-ACP methyl ester carboxylesterase
MPAFTTGLFLDRIPYMRMGSGPRRVVIFYGGNAFLQRLDRPGATRHAARVARLLPRGCTVHILGYDPSPPEGHSLDAVVADFAAILRHETGPATVLGISYGGLVATRLAARHPDLVERLILLVSAHRFSDEGRRRIARQIALVQADDLQGLVKTIAPLFRRPWYNLLVRLKLWRERHRLAARMNEPEAIVRSLGTIAGDDPDHPPTWLAQVRAPTLIVGGARDQFFDVAAMEEAVRLIPDSSLRLLAGETHMLPLEAPGRVAGAIAEFLRTASTPNKAVVREAPSPP